MENCENMVDTSAGLAMQGLGPRHIPPSLVAAAHSSGHRALAKTLHSELYTQQLLTAAADHLGVACGHKICRRLNNQTVVMLTLLTVF